jgi:CheY-like chemotaxis protein
VPAESDHPRVQFEAASLRQAVELAAELRVMAHGRVQVRPAPSRLLRVRWSVTMTAQAVPRAFLGEWTAELYELARRHPGCRLVDADMATPDQAIEGPVRVLIVDDSAPFRRAARELLRQRGYVVVGEAGSVAAARDAFPRIAPDALLLDVRLPDGCGFELAASLVHAQPNLAVLLVSANDPPARDERVSVSGARGFVLKSCLGAAPLDRFWRAPSP